MNIREISNFQKGKIACVILDNNLQQDIINTPNHPAKWMLDFVFDSNLRDKLFNSGVSHAE